MKKIFLTGLFIFLVLSGSSKGYAQATPTSTPSLMCCMAVVSWTSPILSAPSGVAVDRKRGRVYITDNGPLSTFGEGVLLAVNYDGTPVLGFGTGGSVSIAGPFNVAAGPSSYEGVYLAHRDNGAGITKLDTNGNLVWSLTPSPGAWRAICVDDWGNIYAASDTSQIIVLDNAGNPQTAISGGAMGPLGPVGGLWMEGLNLYASDTVNNRIVKYVESGVNTYSYTATQAVTIFTDGYGITKDLVGNFYVALKAWSGYAVWDSNLNQVTQPCAGLFSEPYGIAVDETGSIYVANKGGTIVTKTKACFPQTLPTYHGMNPPAVKECFIYPSPAKGSQANLSYNMTEAGRMELKIWNERAELIDDITDQRGSGVQVTPFNISGFASGVYFYGLTLTYNSGKVETIKPHKFVVIH